jgi:hypothetical protein
MRKNGTGSVSADVALFRWVPRIGAICLAGAMTSACTDDQIPTSVAQPVSVTASREGAGLWTQDHEWAAMADTLPGGFAGFYIEDSNLVVRAVDPMKGSELVKRLEGSPHLGRTFRSRPIRVRPAAHSFRELKDWHDKLLTTLDGSSFVFLDIDEANNVVVVGVSNPASQASVAAAARTAAVPRAALRIEDSEPIVPSQTLNDELRPVMGGLMFSPPGCTVGFNVLHHSYGRGWVTNAHCTPVVGQVHSTVGYQPLEVPGWRIGAEVFDRPGFTGTNSGCPSGRLCRAADVALYKYDDGVPYHLGGIASTIAFNSKVIDSQTLTGWPLTIWSAYDTYCFYTSSCSPYVLGEAMEKIGARSGWTAGTLTATCTTISYPSSIPPGNVTFVCQYGASYFADDGDSGSPVFRRDLERSAVLAGIHTATSNSIANRSWFSPINSVRHDLDPLPWSPQCSVRVTTPSAWSC